VSEAGPRAPIFDLAGKRVWVAGHRGLVGSALVRRLAGEGAQLLMANRTTLDLRRQADVEAWVDTHAPQVVFLAAARVGGIEANRSRPGDFLYDNLAIAANVIHASAEGGVEKLLFLGSSCIYPRLAPQPMREEMLLTGPLEPTNEAYAIAKLAGLKLCESYRRQHGMDVITALPTNLYGPGDNFDLNESHVLAALIRKIHRATAQGGREVEIWGTGTPRREFLHVDDLADALVFMMRHYSDVSPLNVGVGTDVTIAELAGLIARCAGFGGAFRYDTTMPDGAPAKRLDVSRLAALGWRARTALPDGVAATYAWFAAQCEPEAVRL
jgi:GDP-L-fucose synthase